MLRPRSTSVCCLDTGHRDRDYLAIKVAPLLDTKKIKDGWRDISVGCHNISCDILRYSGATDNERDVDVLFDGARFTRL